MNTAPVTETKTGNEPTDNEVTFLGKTNDIYLDETVSDEVIAQLSSAETGDIVKFGQYEQDFEKNRVPKSIDWIVLDKQGPRMLLLSKYVLDAGAYNYIIPKESEDKDKDEDEDQFILKEPEGVWEISSLRSWLNKTFFDSDFIRTAFSDGEKNLIERVRLKNAENQRHHTPGGNDTEDKVFILSNAQIRKYLPTKESRVAYPTPHAKSNGVYCKKDGSCDWWVRTPGKNKFGTNIVSSNGDLNGCYNCRFEFIGIRPALWINLDFNCN